MNNKGQSLVLFVLFLPILILIFCLMFDSALIVSEHVKIKNIGKDAITYLVEKNSDVETVKRIIIKNDKDITIENISNNEVHLKKIIDSYFGKAIGHDTYELEVDFVGYMRNGELVIEEKGN